MKATLVSCLKACQTLALVSSALAAPLSRREGTTGKELLLWEWTLTQAAPSNPDIKASIDQAAASPQVVAASNWDTWRPSEAPADLAFFPMIRTTAQLSGDAWTQLLSSLETEKAAGRQPVVQFLNEPEYQGISAADAATAWRSSILPLRTQYGAQLVGPGPSSSDAGIAWQAAFMGALGSTEKPDFLGIHFYTTNGNPVDSEIAWGQNYLAQEHDKYGIPLFVNEIACTSRDAGQVQQFTDTMKSWMDAQDWIARYGFFGVSLVPANDWVSPAAQLLDTAGKWTALGKALIGL